MSLTQEQWNQKLRSLVPSWVFEKNEETAKIFNAAAKCLFVMQRDASDHIKETFIDEGSEEYVALHGEERSVERLQLEALSSYRERVKLIVNKSNVPAIKSIVDSLLIRGQSIIIEHSQQSGNFLNRNSFLDRNILDFQVLYNAFTIIIDYQIPEPTSFYNRGAFLDREFLNGSSLSSDTVFANVIKAVNEAKAFGTVYRLIERVQT
jgi:hypothetical protein